MTEPRPLDVAVFGIVNSGKSSVINALLGRDARATSPIGGTTTDVELVDWRESSQDQRRFLIRLQDTPGLEDIDSPSRGRLAVEAARAADLVLFVTAEDLTAAALNAILALREEGKPIVVALNKADLLDDAEEAKVLSAIRRGLEGIVPGELVTPIAAAPIERKPIERPDGSVRYQAVRGGPRVDNLVRLLLDAAERSGDDLKALAEARARVLEHVERREIDKRTRREKAERVADESAFALAAGMAINPVPLLDLLTGPGGVAILALRVSEVYGETLSAETAKGLASELLKGASLALWGSAAGVLAGGAMKFLPGFGHLTGALTQGASAGYVGHVLGRAMVDYLENGRDWGDGGIVASLNRIAASTDRRALTRDLVEKLKARLGAKS